MSGSDCEQRLDPWPLGPFQRERTGCDRRWLDVRQEVTGDLVCHRCGRMVAPAPAEDADVR